MARKNFQLNGIDIKNPSSFKVVFATTSTEDSDRTQDLVMHNTPIGTIAGFDITWEILTESEISAIMQQMINRAEFSFYCPNPHTGKWETNSFYASNYSAAAFSLVDGEERWTDLSINIRSIRPI